jgi:hypothetical protein
MGSIVKTTPSVNTNSNGNAIIDWDAKQLGLTAGQWTVQAVATQGSATGTSHNEYLTVQ